MAWEEGAADVVDSSSESHTPEPMFTGTRFEGIMQGSKCSITWTTDEGSVSGIFTQNNGYIPAEHQIVIPAWESGNVEAFNVETNAWVDGGIPFNNITSIEIIK